MRALFVHGIGVDAQWRHRYGERWARALVAHGAMPSTWEAVRWQSSGSAPLDLARVVVDDWGLEVGAVVGTIKATRPDVIVAHSWGTALASMAVCALRDTPAPAIIAMGSPLAHPLWGPALEARGVKIARGIVELWNSDDEVCTSVLPLGDARHRDMRHAGWRQIEVHVDGLPRSAWAEHNDELYLAAAQMRTALDIAMHRDAGGHHG